MTTKLHVQTAGHAGVPYVQVPRAAGRQLVEFLAVQRARVQFTCHDAFVTALFLHLGQDAAQALLDDWPAALREPEDHPPAGLV